MQLAALCGYGDFFAAVFVFHADKTLILKEIERRVDHARLGL
jgi:hypothetical protein